ncbi:MAG TPA: peptidylprolyl isomerase [Cytophagales bacterium]|nr:peptidylprolyl isomerase [Cytophagales bacterium]HAA22523.1 peptidylprolyl isomerase [Cytophagales bacterium]HAP61393.1 peptidylprolyl isomerase [Cytophagales bacterium]
MGASKGDNVKVHYTGTLKDGSVFDSSREREPLGFTLGAGQMIPGFEKAVEGMEVGETVTAELAPEDAYGPHSEEMLVDVPKDQVPADINPTVGQQLQLQRQDGGVMNVVVKEVNEGNIVLDANHPLAGKDLIFEIELMEIN